MVIKTPRELCEDCTKSYGNGCPIWPTIGLTLICVEFIERKTKALND